mmetsp:Transcript_26569/g.33131  ORF Transcript_26569/g.33131 Transcript_26569/m.33131 type:complete len:82 (-) Transcript_26569:1701-1946(-)
MRKQQQAEHGKADLEKVIKDEIEERTRQCNKIIHLEKSIAAHKLRNAERAAADIAKREEEMKFLTFQREHLGNFLQQIEEK